MSVAAASPPGTTTAPPVDDGAPSRAPSIAWVAIVIGACAPTLLSIATVVGQDWHASLDQALELLRIRDVGGPHSPLVGVFSRWGWAHPGPILFYLLAPFERAGGQVGILVGAGVINVAAVAGSVAVGLVRGGVRLGLTLAVLMALLSAGLGPDLLIDPWNPSVAVLPFAAFVVLVWQSMAGARWLLPGAGAVGSFLAQAHVGYVPLVGALLVLAGGQVLLRARGEGVRWRPALTVLAATVAVVAVLWAPPLWQQLTGAAPGNLAALWSYGRAPVDDGAGWGEALGSLGTHVVPWGPWLTGDDTNAVGLARTGGRSLGVVFLGWVAVAGVAAARHRRSAGAAPLVALLVVVVPLSVVATSRIEGFFAPYLTFPWRVVGFLAALTLAWSVVSLVASRVPAVVGAGAGAVGLAVASALVATSLPATPPLPTVSAAVGDLGRQLTAELDDDQRHLLTSVDARTFDAVKPGIVAHLEERGFAVFVDPGPIAALQYGSWRLATPAEVDIRLFLADQTSIDQGWRPPAGSRRVAHHDPLTPTERGQARRLEARIRADMGDAAPEGPLFVNTPYVRGQLVGGGASPSDVAALARLYDRGDAYAVYLVDLS